MSPTLTPLVLISGFLGAGKTTFLRHLLPLLGEKGLRPHLVINDYGEAEIDAASLAQLAVSVRAINGSCVCCESQDEFLNLLASESLDKNSVLLVETNGTTDPYEIIECLGLDERAARYTPPLHVSIIDVPRWQKRWWHNELERLQVRSAGHHYLSKTDVAPPERVEQVSRHLSDLNSAAKKTSPQELVAAIQAEEFTAQPLERDHDHALSDELVHTHGHTHEPDHGEHHHAAHQFVSLQLPVPLHISREKMSAWLRSLPRNVVRAKGFVRLIEAPDRLFSFQKVEDLDDITFLPLSPQFARKPLALLIGTGLSADSLPKLEA